ncbi:ATP-binding cassette domain-containing protein [Candidatus Zixiibacteriota bacterium]
MDKQPAVTATELTKVFGDFTAVDRVSFAVKTGEVFGFLGPNGAGKTTTIKMLAGLLQPSAGRAGVAGLDIYTETERIKQQIGYMSQLFSLYNDLTVEENISFFSGLYGVPREKQKARRDWVLEMAGLQKARSRLTGELPLGFKQRLALGCAVLHDPPILFLDEPTSGVDPLSRRNFWELIYSLTARQTTVFVTTHYMEEAEYCHRLALMNRGRLIALDTPARLRERSGKPVLEIKTPDGARVVTVLKQTPGIIEVGMFGRTVHAVVDSAEIEANIRPALAAKNITVEKIAPIKPSLEDVFISLVQTAGGVNDSEGAGA